MRASARLVLLALTLLQWAGIPLGASAQSALQRTPNLGGGWVGEPGPLHFHLVHRFWTVDAGPEAKLVNSPTMLLGAPLPGHLLVGVHYATNSLVAGDRPNELEPFLRWAPLAPGHGRASMAVTAARNTAAASWDGEVATGIRVVGSQTGGSGPSLSALATVRRLGDAFGTKQSATVLAAGLIVGLSESTAFSADVGRASGEGMDDSLIWGAGLQFRVPASPHTISLHASNSRTSTLQGASSPFRTTWGFEFTAPVRLARFLGGAGRSPSNQASAEGSEVAAVVDMTDELRFAPTALEVRVGQAVAWRNVGARAHTVTIDPAIAQEGSTLLLPDGADPFDSGTVPAGGEFRYTFRIPGIYVYQCLPHESVGMTGVVVVVP